MTERSKTWFELIAGYLDALDVKYTSRAEVRVFNFELTSERQAYKALLLCGPGDVGKDNSFVTLLLIDSRIISENKRNAVLGVLNELSRKIAIGGFELHGAPSGRVVFKSGVALFSGLSEDAFKMQLFGGLSNIDAAQAPLESVLHTS